MRLPPPIVLRAAIVAATLILTVLTSHRAEASPECGNDFRAAVDEQSSRCALLAARAIWLNAHDMDNSFQLYRATNRDEDLWFGSDKAMHLGVSFMLTLSTQYFLVHRMDLPNDRAWPVAAGTALAFGLFKELADSQREHRPLFSWRDMVANAAGVSLALGVILL